MQKAQSTSLDWYEVVTTRSRTQSFKAVLFFILSPQFSTVSQMCLVNRSVSPVSEHFANFKTPAYEIARHGLLISPGFQELQLFKSMDN